MTALYGQPLLDCVTSEGSTCISSSSLIFVLDKFRDQWQNSCSRVTSNFATPSFKVYYFYKFTLFLNILTDYFIVLLFCIYNFWTKSQFHVKWICWNKFSIIIFIILLWVASSVYQCINIVSIFIVIIIFIINNNNIIISLLFS